MINYGPKRYFEPLKRRFETSGTGFGAEMAEKCTDPGPKKEAKTGAKPKIFLCIWRDEFRTFRHVISSQKTPT